LAALLVAADNRRAFGRFAGVSGDLWKYGDRRAYAGCGEKDSS
jgi:hypothetical protein